MTIPTGVEQILDLYEDVSSHALTVIGWDDNFSKENFESQEKYNEYINDKDTCIANLVVDLKDRYDSYYYYTDAIQRDGNKFIK